MGYLFGFGLLVPGLVLALVGGMVIWEEYSQPQEPFTTSMTQSYTVGVSGSHRHGVRPTTYQELWNSLGQRD